MFENLTPLHPTRHLKLERDIKAKKTSPAASST
jgi:transcription termination factor Rho